MSTAFRPQNPNNVSLPREDARNSMGTCPLMKSTVQLIPLRYGIVDNPALNPAGEIPMPYSLSVRPLGIRLLRDGWLHVIEGSSGTLSEYRIDDGLVSAMLWQGLAVFDDDRDEPIYEPNLIFLNTSTLYVAYAEVPWTAKKCQQVLSSPSERNHFMQAVDLIKAECDTGGPHLLTPDMAEQWLAEVATERGSAPLLLKLTYPRSPEPRFGKVSEELLIELELHSLDDKGQLVERTYRIRFDANEGGRFMPAQQHFESNAEMPLLIVDVNALDFPS